MDLRRTVSSRLAAAALAFLVALGGAACGDLEESDLTRGAGIVAGTVRDAGGQPAAAARVFVQDNLALYAVSDAAGAFRIQGVPAGARRVLAYTEGGLGAALDVTVLAGEVTTAALVLAPTGTVAGGVTLAGESDHVGTLVYLLGTSFAAYTDHAGAYRIHFVVPGCYTLRAEHVGFAPKEVGPLCVLAGGARTVGEFTLTAGDAVPCAAGDECGPQQVCVEARCVFAAGFQEERCNGLDDDGDGLVDEGLVELCGSAQGACEPGLSVCLGGAASPCFGALGPRDETCGDGVDDDCDGLTDEGCGPGCGDGVCARDEDGCACPADCPAPACCLDADCPPCLSCASGHCVAHPCLECDVDCGPDETCTDGPDGCCSACVPRDPCAGFACVATCATDQDCGGPDVCVETVPGCCSECVPRDPCALYECVAFCATDEDCEGPDVCVETVPGCCSECRPACLGEGEWTLSGPAPTCCAGLSPLRTTAGILNGTCAEYDCGVHWVCAACGDGVCGVGESFCTCPQDCHRTCVEAGGVMVDDDGCCAGPPALTALPLDASGGCLLFTCAACGDGACGYGETPASCAADCCAPDCAGRPCGDDGCGGSCGSCEDGCACSPDGQCLGGSTSGTLAPDCVHAPPVVRADMPFAIAVYGTTTGCTTFTRATATLTDRVIDLTVHSSTSTCGPCPACLWSYVGRAYVSLPGPGSYTLRVGGGVHGTILASAGGVSEPGCDDACVPLVTEGWTLSFYTARESSVACGGELSEAVTISGSCQDYTLTSQTMGVVPDLSLAMHACTEDLFLFGAGDPRYVQATRCQTAGWPAAEVILGVADYGLILGRRMPEVFVLERN